MAELTIAAGAKAPGKITQAQALLFQTQMKIRKIIDDYAAGCLSRDDFHKAYDHLQAQILLAVQVMADSDGEALNERSPDETIPIRKRWMAKAKAIAVYYHATGFLLETMGEFDVPADALAPRLDRLVAEIRGRIGAKPRVESIEGYWVLFVPGRYSTAILLFGNEPVARQVGIIEHMHRDFETANEAALRSGHADSRKLVYPFLSFVQRSAARH